MYVYTQAVHIYDYIMFYVPERTMRGRGDDVAISHRYNVVNLHIILLCFIFFFFSYKTIRLSARSRVVLYFYYPISHYVLLPTDIRLSFLRSHLIYV